MVIVKEEKNVSVGKKRTSQGRKKIAIEKIQNVSSRQVTFSKRRVGLFKKASELCILTDAEIAIVVHSLGKRVFAFGHPSTDAVIDRFLDEENTNTDAREKKHKQVVKGAREYNAHYSEVCEKLEVEKKRKEVIEEEKRVVSAAAGYGGGGFWWDDKVDGMGLEELEHYAEALDEMIKKVTMRANDLMLIQNSNGFSDPAPVGGIGSSYMVGSCSTTDDQRTGGNNNINVGESGIGEYNWV